MSDKQFPCNRDNNADSRRSQILSAAALCFCKHGFHGASIALISKTASMSAGHIYHYFANKEAIIAAIVEQDRQDVLEMFDQFRNQNNIIEAMLAYVEAGIDRATDPDRTALHLEILAEATRNSHISNILRESDAKLQQNICLTLKSIPALKNCSDEMLYGIAEILCSMFSGLMVRSTCNPDLPKKHVISIFRQMIRELLNNNLSSDSTK